ncbi:MAG TPA: hypothetical protein VLD55_03635, partial [Candidatus Sulfobium mesophilum]|nr:hypothetical protein [Candidatus Sulfobium mesophilum]
MYNVMHEQKSSADRVISGGTSHNRDEGSGKAIPSSTRPESAGYSHGRKRDVEPGYCGKAWDNKANSAAVAGSIFSTSIVRTGIRCASSRPPAKHSGRE